MTYYAPDQELAQRYGDLRVVPRFPALLPFVTMTVRVGATTKKIPHSRETLRRELASLRRLLIEDLVHQLRRGELRATALDGEIPPSFWTMVDVDTEQSAVTGHGRQFTNVLIFPPRSERAGDNQAPESSGPVAETEPADEPRPGRRPRGVDYTASDAPLLEEMKRLIDSKGARNPMDAALAVAGRAQGFGNPVSKAKRLLTRFKARAPERRL